MKKIKFALAMSFTTLCLSFLPTISYAECYCTCINNKKTKVCENKYDANYVYCSGTYCSAELQNPDSEMTKSLYALLENIGELSKFNKLTSRECRV